MTKVYDTATDLITFARGSSATYLDSDGVLKTAATDAPRIEYAADGSLKGLLIEEQRTNLVALSEDFENAAWGKAGTTAIDSTLVIGPDGTLSGRRVLNFDDAVGDRLIEQVSITNATLTGSMWVKGEGDNIGKDILLTVKRNGGTFAGTDVSHTLTADWKRINATFTQLPDNTGAQIVLNNPANGNEASEVLVYGAQLEEGSFPTSYIPTAGSQSTRSADIASIPVNAFGYNQTAGTVVVEAVSNYLNGVGRNFTLSDGTTANRIQSAAYFNSHFAVDAGGSAQASLDAGTFTQGQYSRLGGAYATDSVAVVIDGGTVASDTSAAMPTGVTTLTIGCRENQSSNFLNGHLKSLKYFPRRLTNAQLQELTS